MSYTLTQEVVRISDRFMSRSDPYSIDRQGRLGNITVLVVIFYVILGIAFVKLEEMERRHPRIISDVDVSFELSAPPSEPEFRTAKPGQNITAGEFINPPGTSGSPSAASSQSPSLPSPQAQTLTRPPTPVRAKPIPSRYTTVAPPVAVATTAAVNTQPTADLATKPSETAGVSSEQNPSGTPIAGGTASGVEGGVGVGTRGTGTDGNGSSSGQSGNAGGGGGPLIASATPRILGNIAPYRKELLIRIAQNWHPKRKNESLVVAILLDHSGNLLSSEVLESSGNKKSDKEAIAAIEKTAFAPLPDWYKGNQMMFKIELAKVEAILQ
jgi:TonB family protein